MTPVPENRKGHDSGSSAAARKRLVVQRRRIAPGWHVGVFRNAPFVIFDFGKLRIEVGRV